MRMSHRRALLQTGNAPYHLSFTGTILLDAVYDKRGASLTYPGLYRLLILSASGTLTVTGNVRAHVCALGGGGDGTDEGGGGAGFFEVAEDMPLVSGAVDVAPANSGATSYNGLSAPSATGKNGSSGGGGKDLKTPGTGDGRSGRIFHDYIGHVIAPNGGGGGALRPPIGNCYNGGHGGAYGRNGEEATQASTSQNGLGGQPGATVPYGRGGKGGAIGYTSESRDGEDAPDIGGGGGSRGSVYGGSSTSSVHGKGAPGALILLIDMEKYTSA